MYAALPLMACPSMDSARTSATVLPFGIGLSHNSFFASDSRSRVVMDFGRPPFGLPDSPGLKRTRLAKDRSDTAMILSLLTLCFPDHKRPPSPLQKRGVLLSSPSACRRSHTRPIKTCFMSPA